MQYIVGTGRCGTKSLARLLGGLHEPAPAIVAESRDFYFGRRRSLPRLLEKLARRAALPTPAIADNRQSYVIPLILEVDFTAEFVLLVREPRTCIASMHGRGAFQRPKWYWDRHRIAPRTGFPNDWTPVMKLCWSWIETHRVILSSLGAANVRILLTSDLPGTLENASAARPALTFSETEQRFFDEHVVPFWREIQKLHAATKRFDISPCHPVATFEAFVTPTA